MPDGFFLGGVARQRLAQGEIDLQNRRLEQDERAAAQAQQNKILNDLRSQRQDLFTQLDKVVQASSEGGLTQEQFLSGARPIAEQIVAHADGARRAGFDFSPQGDAELARSKIGLFRSPEQLAQQERERVIRAAQNEADAQTVTSQQRLETERRQNIANTLNDIESANVIASQFPAEQRFDILASRLGIRQETQSSVRRLLDEINQAQDPQEKSILQQALNSELAGDGLAIQFDDNGNISSITQGAIDLPSTRVDDIRQEIDTFENGANIANQLLEQLDKNPDLFGISGAVTRGVRQLKEGVSEITDLIPGAESLFKEPVREFNEFTKTIRGEVEPDAQSRLIPASFGGADILRSQLVFSLARSLQGNGKLLAGTIDKAEELINIRGLTNDVEIRERLTGIKALFEQSLADSKERISEKPNATSNEFKTIELENGKSVGFRVIQ